MVTRFEMDAVKSRAVELADALEGIATLLRDATEDEGNIEGCMVYELVLDAEDKVGSFINWYLDEDA